MLFQIAEPGESVDPHQRRFAVGIDLGTTHSLVAAVRSGFPEALPDEQGAVLLPSVVRYVAGQAAIVGAAALAEQSLDPTNTIVSVKRLMGRGLDDLKDTRGYHLGHANGMVVLDTCVGVRSPVEVSAEILRTLCERAEQSLSGEFVGAVVTVPAYFDDAQRQATKDAARLAGLTVLRLLNEPTAAAVAYGLDKGVSGTYVVFDLGGGTFDVSILKLTQGVFEVVAIGGDSALGGDDFDRAICDWVCDQLHLTTLSQGVYRTISAVARQAKETLTDQPSADMTFDLPERGSVCCELTREQFFSMTSSLVKKTIQTTRRALRDADLAISAVDGVILVGGATRMPHVQQAVADFFGRQPLTDLDPDQVVALGAAIQADALIGNRRADDGWVLLDVTPLSFGIETMGELVEKIIPRNSSIPCARAQEFTTYTDGQTAMSIHVLQGERELVRDCRSLARFELRGIPPMVAGAARVRVTFQIDTDGLLSVTARELSSGISAEVSVQPACGLSEADIMRMLQASTDYAQHDEQLRLCRVECVNASRLLLSVESALFQDGETLLQSTERSAIEQSMAHLRTHLERVDALCDRGGAVPVSQVEQHDTCHLDVQALRASMKTLNNVSTEFAGRRMDKTIRQVLQGQHVDQIAQDLKD